jgi:DNA (cytosine-5)-methyltransferase 1
MTGQITFGSLFAGIGGFDLGFERAGIRCVWQVENHPKRQQVLRKFWNVPIWSDIEAFPPEHGFIRPNVLCGGFPCQDISYCGHGAGIEGERSGLWSHYARLIRHFRPDFAVMENVSALLTRGIDRVLGDLAACGFDAEWDCLPASAFGAYHDRDRIFIVAYPSRVDGRSHDLLEAGREWAASLQSRRLHCMAVATDSRKHPNKRLGCEPGLDRLVRRVPGALDRLEGVGNSIYPAAAEWIGRRIVAAMSR